jgi:hypothetical protein
VRVHAIRIALSVVDRCDTLGRRGRSTGTARGLDLSGSASGWITPHVWSVIHPIREGLFGGPVRSVGVRRLDLLLVDVRGRWGHDGIIPTPLVGSVVIS